MTSSVVLDISISADEYLRHYAGSAHHVVARARDGRKVRFPADLLRRFVTHSGIHGSFRIYFDAQGKFQAIERLELC